MSEIKTAEQIGQEIIDLASTHCISVDILTRLLRLSAMLADVGISEEDICRALIKAYPVHLTAITIALRTMNAARAKPDA